MGAVVRIVPAIFQMLSIWCPYKLFVFAFIKANAPVSFPVPQMQEGLDEREALDCFILDYIDYCTVMGCIFPRAQNTVNMLRSQSVKARAQEHYIQ